MRSKTLRCPTHHPIAHIETSSVPGNARLPNSRPERWLKHPESTTAWPALLDGRSLPGAEQLPVGNGPRSGVLAYPRIEPEPCRGAIPSPAPEFEAAIRARNEI